MSKYRVGQIQGGIDDSIWVVQKKRWWGWSAVRSYFYKENAYYYGKMMECKGHQVIYC